MTGRPFDLIAWIKAMTETATVSSGAVRVGIRLALYADAGTGKNAFPGNARLAADVGVTERSVERALVELTAVGAVHRETVGSRSGRRARASVWTMLPAPWSAPGTPDNPVAEHPTILSGTPDTSVDPPAHVPTHGSTHGKDTPHADASGRRLTTLIESRWKPDGDHRRNAGLDLDEIEAAFRRQFECTCPKAPRSRNWGKKFSAFIEAFQDDRHEDIFTDHSVTHTDP